MSAPHRNPLLRRCAALARCCAASACAALITVFATAEAAAADASIGCPPTAAPLTAERVAAGLQTARDHGFLWRLQKGGRTSYLYGTLHAARADWMFPGPIVLDALRAADTVALELDVLDPDIQRRLAAHIGPVRPDPLPPALTRRIEQRRVAECVADAPWNTFSPEFQVASLAMLAGRRDGIDPAHAIDIVLALLARDLGKSVVSLETPEGQMQALRMPTQAATVEFVRSGLDAMDSGRLRPLLNRLARIWTEGDHAELARYRAWCECLDTPVDRQAMKRLLDDRNPSLAAAIDALHASGKQVFAAVGSLHMIGPTGLPSLLRKRGYKVEQGTFGR